MGLLPVLYMQVKISSWSDNKKEAKHALYITCNHYH